jgi:esterase/lipase superfamily enzyme
VEIPVDLEETTNTGALALGDDPAAAPHAQSFAESINRALDRAESKNIFIYVHGAKSSFQRSMQQAAQFHHFMAQDNVFISLSWPTTQSFLTYGTDVKNAVRTVEPFADLLEFLAQNTKAEKINILAYSAGSQVVSPGLFALRQRYREKGSSELKRHLRLGEVYFAAPDIATRVFAVDHLPVFSDMVNRTTFTFNDEDTVLGLSQQMNGVSRIGRPDIKDLDEEEIGWLEKAAQDSRLNVIDMSYEPVKRDVDFKPHGDWYLNPWASSDVIIQFLFSADPSDRGLLQKPDRPVWYYPADYPERLSKIIEKAKQSN